MNGEVQFVLAIIGIAGLLFASGRVRFDIVASLVIMSLSLGGILTPEEAFAGFGDPLVITVAGLLIIADMTTRTGIADQVGDWLSQVGGDSEIRLQLVAMGCAALLGCILFSTAVVAILIPVMVQVSQRSGIHLSRLLLPLSYAAMISGMLTLFGTISNLIVNAELAASGYQPFGFFAITPIGLSVLLASMLCVSAVGRYLLPDRQPAPVAATRYTNLELLEEYGLADQDELFSVPGDSLLVGLKISDSIFTRFSARILLVQRYEVFGEAVIANPGGNVILKPGDSILLAGSESVIEELALAAGLERRQILPSYIKLWEREVGNAVVMVHSESNLRGRSLAEIGFSRQYGVHVLAIKRRGELLPGKGSTKLESGDSLLVGGSWQRIAQLRSWSTDFVLVSQPVEAERFVPQRRKAPIALAIVLAMILISASGLVPIVIVVLLAVGAGVVTGCLSMDDAYRAIPWSSIVLIAGLLPVAVALQKTGGVDVIVNALVSGVPGENPYLIMSTLFFLAALLRIALSNAGTAVLLTPIAVRAAEVTGVEPYAFAMTVAIAVSAAFVFPFTTPLATLVVEPGGYRIIDFLKLGVPHLLLTWGITVALCPLLFPF